MVRNYLRLSGGDKANETRSVKNLIDFAVKNISHVSPLSRLLINCLLIRGRSGSSRTSTARMCHISGSSRSTVLRLCSLSRQNLYYTKI